MKLAKIQYFIEIVQSGSMSKAAANLYISQPSLSRYLAKLENEFGVALFEREKNNKLTLTPNGQQFYETALKINELWLRMEQSFLSSKSVGRDIINIGIADDDLQPYISSCIEELSFSFPDTQCRLFHYNVKTIQEKIIDGSLDLATSAFYEMNEKIKYVVFRRSEIDLVVSKSNSLSKFSYQIPGQEELRFALKDLMAGKPVALIHEPTILRTEENKYMKHMHISPNVQRTYVEHETISEIMQHDKKLLGFCPRHLQSDAMAYIALDPPFFYKSAVYYSKSKTLSAAEKKMVNLLCKQPLTRKI